jgi:hypothetical protein
MKTLLAILVAGVAAATAGTAAAEGYRLLQKVEVVPGAGIFDYAAMDATNRRAYISHGEELVVIDADSNALIGKSRRRNSILRMESE